MEPKYQLAILIVTLTAFGIYLGWKIYTVKSQRTRIARRLRELGE